MHSKGCAVGFVVVVMALVKLALLAVVAGFFILFGGVFGKEVAAKAIKALKDHWEWMKDKEPAN